MYNQQQPASRAGPGGVGQPQQQQQPGQYMPQQLFGNYSPQAVAMQQQILALQQQQQQQQQQQHFQLYQLQQQQPQQQHTGTATPPQQQQQQQQQQQSIVMAQQLLAVSSQLQAQGNAQQAQLYQQAALNALTSAGFAAQAAAAIVNMSSNASAASNTTNSANSNAASIAALASIAPQQLAAMAPMLAGTNLQNLGPQQQQQFLAALQQHQRQQQIQNVLQQQQQQQMANNMGAGQPTAMDLLATPPAAGATAGSAHLLSSQPQQQPQQLHPHSMGPQQQQQQQQMGPAQAMQQPPPPQQQQQPQPQPPPQHHSGGGGGSGKGRLEVTDEYGLSTLLRVMAQPGNMSVGPSLPLESEISAGTADILTGRTPHQRLQDETNFNYVMRGFDLHHLGLSVSQQELLHCTVATLPLDDHNFFVLPDFKVPDCYRKPKPKPLSMRSFGHFKEETLFYIFYSMPRDVLHLAAARALYERGWQYQKSNQQWFRPLVKLATAPEGGSTSNSTSPYLSMSSPDYQKDKKNYVTDITEQEQPSPIRDPQQKPSAPVPIVPCLVGPFEIFVPAEWSVKQTDPRHAIACEDIESQQVLQTAMEEAAKQQQQRAKANAEQAAKVREDKERKGEKEKEKPAA